MKAENQVASAMTIRENKLALVERLADDLAHEIKNPLHSMVINLEVLRRRLARLGPETGDDLLRYAAILNTELERVNRRIDLLLCMVRPYREAGDLATLPEVLDELRELVELECERNEVEFRLEAPTTIMRARLPRSAVRQLILGLILETLDSLSPGDALTVTSESDVDRVRLFFVGLPREAASAVPEPAADLGSYLEVARDLARSLGGRLELPSASRDMVSGGGAPTARFILTLPRDA